MNFSLSDDQRMLVDSVQRFSTQDVRAAAPQVDMDGAMSNRLFQQAAELGLPLDAIPDAHGGYLEGPFLHLFRALRGDQLGAACAGIAHQLESITDVALILAKGDAAVQERWFKRITDLPYARAAVLGADDGFTVEPAGDGLRLSGKQSAVLLAESAEIWMVRATGAAGTVLVLLPGKPEGAETVRLSNTGWRACDACDVHLTGTTIPTEDILARGSEADEWWAGFLDTARLSAAARGIGVAQAAIDFARDYAADRVQFGRPIGKFQSISQMIEESQLAVDAARLLVFETAARVDGGQRVSDRIRMVKAHVARVLTRASIDAVQVLGGYGFVNDYPVEKYYRDARVFETLYGRDMLESLIDMQVAV